LNEFRPRSRPFHH